MAIDGFEKYSLSHLHALFFVVSSGVAGELENLGRQVFQNSGHIDQKMQRFVVLSIAKVGYLPVRQRRCVPRIDLSSVDDECDRREIANQRATCAKL